MPADANETGAVRLRSLAQGDEPLFRALYTDAQTMRFVGSPWTPAEAARRFRAIICRQDESTPADRFLVIEGKSTREPMGICGSSHYDRVGMRVEVGVMLLALGQRAGAGRGALMALVDHLFESPLVAEVYARVAVGHSAASNLARRAGFRPDPVARGGEQDVGEHQWSAHRSTWRTSEKPTAGVVNVQRDRLS
jgi:RimJ/RimL family protein N-acetyltransferase